MGLNDDEAAKSRDRLSARLRALEEHRNALEIAWIALARRLPLDAKTAVIGELRSIAADAAEKNEPNAVEMLRSLADALDAMLPDGVRDDLECRLQ